MRIIITLSQLKKILKSQQLKYPITFKGEDFTEGELLVLKKLFQLKERG
jgi:hypothetical protein